MTAETVVAVVTLVKPVTVLVTVGSDSRHSSHRRDSSAKNRNKNDVI